MEQALEPFFENLSPYHRTSRYFFVFLKNPSLNTKTLLNHSDIRTYSLIQSLSNPSFFALIAPTGYLANNFPRKPPPQIIILMMS